MARATIGILLFATVIFGCGDTASTPDAASDASVDTVTQTDSLPDDTGPPPIQQHPCDEEGACIDWVIGIGDSNIEARVWDVQQTTDGLLIAGQYSGSSTSESTLRVGPSGTLEGATGNGGFAARLLNDGSLSDGHVLPGYRMNAIAQLDDGGTIVVGQALFTSASGTIYVARLTESFDVTWEESLGTSVDPSGRAVGVQITPAGRLFVLANVADAFPGATGDPVGDTATVVLELDVDSGGTLWARTLGGVRTVRAEELFWDEVERSLYVALHVQTEPAETLELGAAGSFTSARSNGFVLTVDPSNGSPIHAWHISSADFSDARGLTRGPDGVVAASRTWRSGISGAPTDTVMRALLLGPTSASRLVEVTGSELHSALAMPAADGMILVGTARGYLEDIRLSGFTGGSDIFVAGFDRHRRRQWTKFDGDGRGWEYIEATGSNDGRLNIFGAFSDAISFEGHFASGPRARNNGFILQLTLPSS